MSTQRTMANVGVNKLRSGIVGRGKPAPVVGAKKGQKRMKTCDHLSFVVVYEDGKCPVCTLHRKSEDFDNVCRWAVEQYKLQVSQRPDVNQYKRTLDEVWNQVIAKLKIQNDDFNAVVEWGAKTVEDRTSCDPEAPHGKAVERK